MQIEIIPKIPEEKPKIKDIVGKAREFIDGLKNQLYCSNKCKSKAYYERHKKS